MNRKYLLIALMGLVLALPGCQGCPVAPPPEPYAPSDLAGAAVSFSEISLAWKDNSPDETGFYIYRKTTGNYSKVAVTEANATSYNDTGLNSSTTYWYKVCAYNEGGNSEFSNEVSAITPSEVEVLDYHMEEERFGYDWIKYTTTIVGNVRNNTDRTLTIWIAGKFFDQNGVIVKKSYDVLDPVGAGETWQFKIVYWNGIGERISRVEAWVDDYY